VTFHPDIEELEALARGEGTAEARAHAGGCAECAREVEWARAERALFARRPVPSVDALWPAIEARIAPKPLSRRPHWHRRALATAAGAAAAAAVLFVAVRPRHVQVAPKTEVAQQKTDVAQGQPQPARQVPTDARRSRLDPKALAALDTAENDYRHAAAVLEAEYETLRPHLEPALAKKWDETLTRARTQLVQSRAVASDDVRARMRVLDGYAEYLRSLRDVIQDSEEATP
jgi:hypothetical protein